MWDFFIETEFMLTLVPVKPLLRLSCIVLKVRGVFLAEVGWLRSPPLSRLEGGGGRRKEESWPRFPLWS